MSNQEVYDFLGLKNKQEVYNALVEASCNGTFPSVHTDGTCRYYNGNNRCAIGVLIPDNPEMEPQESKGYMNQKEEFRNWFRSLFNEKFTDFDFTEMQSLHDCQAHYCLNYKQPWNPHDFIKNLNKMACFKDVEKVVELPKIEMF
jgi:hypothetical protein